jgi:DNA-binding transcriptional MerR regulator
MRIGEIAGLVGISTRAIRHYHHVGLLAEPARKANGYREYSLRDAGKLARVRRLTELGLGLDEVGDALASDADRDLTEILRELDADLARQEADLRRRRARLAQLLRQAEVGSEFDELAGSPANDPRVEATAQAIVAAIPEPARQAIRFPDGGFEETDEGFAAAFYADFAPAQAAAIRRAVGLMREARRADRPAGSPEGNQP